LERVDVCSRLVRFGVLSVALLGVGRLLNPSGFLWLPRKRPWFWLVFLLLYPPLSVLPQSLLWRVFFVHRYAALLGDPHTLVIVGAAAFALGHLAFWNLPAMVMTGLGGALFLGTYLDTRSLLMSAAEHSAYGFVALTAGLGKFLYRGGPAVPRSRVDVQR
jgi:membrane protease YdiL (CAAX protease family)